MIRSDYGGRLMDVLEDGIKDFRDGRPRKTPASYLHYLFPESVTLMQ
ncbi:MAG: hypothetical protein SD837_02695 [Candidatus Electrothrix scaldis]|nr:MAG: hypothetical protein SD837_02695 [Candidatus Electrothrix sp. GW3-3]